MREFLLGLVDLLVLLCRVVLIACIIGYLLVVGISLFVGVDLLLKGEMSKGISVLTFAIIIAVCIYVWLVRGSVKHIREMKE